jgi:hypothetical protein
VIPFGSQPMTQLSLDYLMQENYAGGLANHANYGKWVEPNEPNRYLHQDGESTAIRSTRVLTAWCVFQFS